MKKMDQADEIFVIGAGVIGLSIALELQRRGHNVHVIERRAIAAEASSRNAGAFAFSDIIPLATPGIMRKAPKWLLDPLGPLSIRPSYAVKLTPWLWRFFLASQNRNYHASVRSQNALMTLSNQALERQTKLISGEDLLLRCGQLQLYRGEKSYRESLNTWDLRKEFGVAFDLLDRPEAIAEIQPGLHSQFTHAAYVPSWTNTVCPKKWVNQIGAEFQKRGGKITIAELLHINTSDEGVQLQTAEHIWTAKKLVIAAGAWSKGLATMLGDDAPLETERGYNTTLPAGAFDLRTHLTFPDDGFVVTPINGGVRVGGAVELGGLKAKPNFKRSDVLLAKAKSFMPKLNTENGTQWMGFRPSMPDSLPVISKSLMEQNVYYAFGHGHLGLTQSAGTAELLADLLEGKTPAIPSEPYSLNRF